MNVSSKALIVVLLVSILLMPRCAKVGTFTGGDKDSLPPVLVSSRPEQGALFFNSKKIELDFNEYLTLKSIQQEFLVSPPLKEKPVTKLKGRSILIEMKDSLQPNTTYTLNFGNAITDFTEGNPVPNFEYVFSTGASIDSFSFKGKIFNAFDLKSPKDPVLVMLYENLSDSAPYLEIPRYAGRVGKEGVFRLNNLRPGKFRAFALSDGNNNLRFDPPDEAIAFADSLITLDPALFPADTLLANPDTVPQFQPDSLLTADSLRTDSLPSRKEYAVKLELSLFKEKNKKQYLADYKRPDDKRLNFIFSLPLRDTFSVVPLDTLLTQDWARRENSPNQDTLIYWITDTVLIKKEFLKLLVTQLELDSLNKPVIVTDTLEFRFSPKAPPKRKKDQPPPPVTVQLLPGMGNTRLIDLYSPLIFTSPLPFDSLDTKQMVLCELVDSVEKPVKYQLERDSLYPRTFYLNVKWKEEGKYKCTIFPPAVKNIYGIAVDTLQLTFSAQKTDYYGKLVVSVNGAKTPVLIQLLDRDKVVRQIAAPNGGKLSFNYLAPKKYLLKAVEDRNGNGKWDTGDYLEHQQPEKLLFYKEEFEIRSNWDLEVDIDMSKVK